MSRALISGGSLAGLATAKVLSAYFDEVIVVEADKEPLGEAARKGVPQGRHVHGLLKGGADALTRLFPDLPKELEKSGASSANFSNDIKWYINRRFIPRFEGDLTIQFQSRPLLERCVRDFIRALGNVFISYETKVVDYMPHTNSERISAAVLKQSNGEVTTIEADLFIDATGRGSALPKWLESNGWGRVPLSETRVDLGYASCFLKLPDDVNRDWTSLLIYPTGPEEVRGCTLVQVENETWLLTLAGYHNDHPPADKAGFLEYAKNLPQPEVYEAIKDAVFLTDISLHKFPASIRRHYNKLPSFPLGLIPVGDTNVSLNPLFGQGMSVAVLSVQSLAGLLDDVDLANNDSLRHLRDHYLKSLDTIFQTPWDLAMGQDFKYPQTQGVKPFGMSIKNYFKSLILSSSSTDVIQTFYGVVHLVEDEKVFYQPARALKVLRTASYGN